MNKVAQYEVERVALYTGTQVTGQIKTLTLYTDARGWLAQIGGGKPVRCEHFADHAGRGGFMINKARWVKV